MNIRERWYHLHRARRVFYREQQKHFTELICFGRTIQRVALDSNGTEMVAQELALRVAVMRAAERLVNPPIVYDPELPGV